MFKSFMILSVLAGAILGNPTSNQGMRFSSFDEMHEKHCEMVKKLVKGEEVHGFKLPKECLSSSSSSNQTTNQSSMSSSTQQPNNVSPVSSGSESSQSRQSSSSSQQQGSGQGCNVKKNMPVTVGGKHYDAKITIKKESGVLLFDKFITPKEQGTSQSSQQ